jgi:hypothetical protein
VVPGTTPDEFETKLVREIASMPPGRSGYTTIKTIEETLRSKAGQLGGTRKEVPMRLDRLQQMGLFKRETRPRGTGHVEVGELVKEHPLMANLTAGIVPAQAPPPRLPRQPRSAPPPRPATTEAQSSAAVRLPEAEVIPEALTAEVAADEAAAEAEPIVGAVTGPVDELVSEAVSASQAKPAEAEPEAAKAEPGPVEAAPFRWVTGLGSTETAAPAEKADLEATVEPKPKRAPRKTAAKPRGSSRAKKPAPKGEPGSEATASGDLGDADSGEPEIQPAEDPTDQTVPV